MKPLDGLLVIDFTRQMAGPYATAMLASYGADVIKVESLPHGDPSRRTGVDFIEGESALFLMWNHGKRSIALNLRDSRSLSVVRKLVEQADVLVENYRPGVADNIGIGYDAMIEANPRLVYCSISGFGPDGPMAAYPATDPVIQGMSGVMSVTGTEDSGPLLAGIPIADYTGALLAVQGILLAIAARDKTGEGQKVDLSLLFGLMAGLTTRLASYWSTGERPKRWGSAHSVVVPYQAFETADGYAMAGVWGEGDFPKFCEAVGRPDLATHARFRTNQARLENRDELIPILADIFRNKTTSEWGDRFFDCGAIFGPLLSLDETLSHPHVLEADIVDETNHPVAGAVRHLKPPIRLSKTPGSVDRPPPLLGQHTAEVLQDLGIPESEIGHLREEGVVRVTEELATEATG